MCYLFECGMCKDVLCFIEIIFEFWIDEIWVCCLEVMWLIFFGNSVFVLLSDDVVVILCRFWVKIIMNV